MNILHIVGGLPSEKNPHYQPFIQSQIDSLIAKGLDIEIMDLKGYKTPLNYITSISKIRKIIKRKKIEIIHAHYAYCGLTALLAKTKLPIILSIMGSDLHGSTDSKGNRTIRGTIDRIITKNISRFVDYIIVKSNRMKSQLNSGVLIDVIPNGVNLEIFKPDNVYKVKQELNFEPSTFYVLFLANPKRYVKNFALANKSVDAFKNYYGYNNIKILATYGLNQSEIVKYMNASDVLILTSFWEGSPNVIKEAMACNLPIISTDVGDVKEIISGTSNCFLVPFDAEVIAQKLKIIYDNRSRSDGRERIRHLSDDKIADKIISIYKSLINYN